MTYFTGIDVSLRSVSICIVDEHGEVCHEAKTAAQPSAISQCLSNFSADVKSVGLEAGSLTQYLTYGVQVAGFEVILPTRTRRAIGVQPLSTSSPCTSEPKAEILEGRWQPPAVDQLN